MERGERTARGERCKVQRDGDGDEGTKRKNLRKDTRQRLAWC